jgi:hypothetical protein
MTKTEMAHLNRFSPIQHDPDSCVPTATVQGIPGRVFRPIAEADWSISVGIAELHQYAGLSGGHKGVSVGCGGRETISALHHRSRVLSSGVRVGAITGNPFRQAVDELGKAARCRLALVFVPAVRRWLFGDPIEVIKKAHSMISPWETIDEMVDGAILRVPPAKGISLYQASRAATYLALSPSPPVRIGGTLAIEAPLPEGLGHEAGFVAALSLSGPPWNGLLEGAPPTGAGAQRAVMLALLARNYRLEVYGCLNPRPLLAVGIQAFSGSPPTDRGWIDVREPFTLLPQCVG